VCTADTLPSTLASSEADLAPEWRCFLRCGDTVLPPVTASIDLPPKTSPKTVNQLSARGNDVVGRLRYNGLLSVETTELPRRSSLEALINTQSSLASGNLSLDHSISFHRFQSAMEDFKPPKIDLSKYPFPLQAFIGGSFVDSAVDDRHTLQSSVNDATITQGR
jgi:hypothetical protein